MVSRASLDKYLGYIFNDHLLGFRIVIILTNASLYMHFVGSPDIERNNITLRIACVLMSQLALMLGLRGSYRLCRLIADSRKGAITFLATLPALGALRGFVLEHYLYDFNLVSGGDLMYRVYGSAITMTACIVGLSFVVGAYEEWSKRSAELELSHKKLELVLNEASVKVKSDLTEDLGYIRSELLRGLHVNSARRDSQLIETLQSIVVEVLKPMSAKLIGGTPLPTVEAANLNKVKFQFSSLMQFLTLRQSVRPALITIGVVVTFIPLVLRFEGLVTTLEIVAMAVLLITPCLVLLKKYASNSVDSLPVGIRLPVVIGLLASTCIPFAILFPVLEPDCADIRLLPLQCLISVVCLGFTFGLGSAAGSETQRLHNLQIANSEEIRWNTARLFATHWFHKRQYARKLHGPMQAEILANVIRIEKSMEDGEDFQVFGEASRKALEDKLMELLNKDRADMLPDQVLAELAETWDGICTIDVSFDEGLVTKLIEDQIACETVLEIIREATSNAIQHGVATQIRVCVAYGLDRCIALTVTDNGSGVVSESSDKGLGSRYLAECTMAYALESDAAGTKLTAQIPLACSNEAASTPLGQTQTQLA